MFFYPYLEILYLYQLNITENIFNYRKKILNKYKRLVGDWQYLRKYSYNHYNYYIQHDKDKIKNFNDLELKTSKTKEDVLELYEVDNINIIFSYRIYRACIITGIYIDSIDNLINAEINLGYRAYYNDENTINLLNKSNSKLINLFPYSISKEYPLYAFLFNYQNVILKIKTNINTSTPKIWIKYKDYKPEKPRHFDFFQLVPKFILERYYILSSKEFYINLDHLSFIHGILISGNLRDNIESIHISLYLDRDIYKFENIILKAINISDETDNYYFSFIDNEFLKYKNADLTKSIDLVRSTIHIRLFLKKPYTGEINVLSCNSYFIGYKEGLTWIPIA